MANSSSLRKASISAARCFSKSLKVLDTITPGNRPGMVWNSVFIRCLFGDRPSGSAEGVVEPQGNEAALLIQRVAKGQVALPTRARLQLRPVRAERIRRHADRKSTRLN